MYADVESSAIIGKPSARADVDAYLIGGVLVGPRASRAGRHTSLSGVLSELVERAIYGVNAHFSLVIGEEVEGVAPSHAESEPSSGWNLRKGVEV